jgi:isopentenyldiphosphate isomerase
MSDQNTASPPDELFDILNEDGGVTGNVKRRADVHRDGDWHRAFHLWIAGKSDEGASEVLFQRRSVRKDTWPRRLDVAVGGHFRAGETIHDVIREIDEEVGIAPRLDDLVYVGVRRAVSLNDAWQDREIQDVYVLALNAGWPRFAPNADEIESLVRVEGERLLRLCRGEVTSVNGLVADVIAERQIGDWHLTTIELDDFVPTEDGYLMRGTIAAMRALAGDSSVALEAIDVT